MKLLRRALPLAMIIALLSSVEARPTRRKKKFTVRGRWSKKEIKNARNNEDEFVLGNGRFDAADARPQMLQSAPNRAPGASGPSMYAAPLRPQLNGNFGLDPAAPQRLPKKKQFKVTEAIPPDASLSDVPQLDNIQTMSIKERESAAIEFFVRANYNPTQLTNKKKLIKEMQRNYGLTATGLLDDKTVSLMMAPRCGYPDGPAAYRTFSNDPKWANMPVTYKPCGCDLQTQNPEFKCGVFYSSESTITGYSPDISGCQTRNIVKRAFRVWEEVTNIDFAEGDDETDVDMDIYFGYQEHGDGYPFDGKNGLLAHAFTAGTNRLSGDTHFDEAEFWTLGQGRVLETYYGNANGAECVFPFIFESQQYDSCTTNGRSDGLEWCATTANYDDDGDWGFCPQETLFTYGGNGAGEPCVFPFIFLGKTYTSCTYDGRSDGYRWCSTTSNFDSDSSWGFCPDRAHGTYGGNSDGNACVFPFMFNGNSYDSCTRVGRNDYKSWCATTANYDVDQKFGFCQDSGYSLFLVAAHEIGHAIGLDHSNRQEALMYPSYSYVSDFRLPDDDRDGARHLYGGRRARPLPPLQLERCGGDLNITDGGLTTTPSTRSTTPLTRSTTPSTRSTTPATRPTMSTSTPQVGICGWNKLDAMVLVGKEMFLFKGTQFYRSTFEPHTSPVHRGPYVIREQWRDVSETVDAAYYNLTDDTLTLYGGLKYWKIKASNGVVEALPRKLRGIGIEGTTFINGVLNWRRSKDRRRTYLFTKKKFYRYNEQTRSLDKGYPKSISGSWKKIPLNFDAVSEHPFIKKYSVFTKDNQVYFLNNYKVRVAKQIPLSEWFDCPGTQSPGPLPIYENLKRIDDVEAP